MSVNETVTCTCVGQSQWWHNGCCCCCWWWWWWWWTDDWRVIRNTTTMEYSRWRSAWLAVPQRTTSER